MPFEYECPGPKCLMCAGTACNWCGAGCWNNAAPHCEHSTDERHREPVTMNLELIIFTGLQASGKTTLYRERFATTHVLVSKDLWPNASKKEDRQRQLIEANLRSGRSVVVDNTNPSPADRAPLIAIARSLEVDVVSYFFHTSAKEALLRNEKREGRKRVPDVGIYSVAKRLVVPHRAEGFDRMFVVHTVTNGGFMITESA